MKYNRCKICGVVIEDGWRLCRECELEVANKTYGVVWNKEKE